MPSSLFEKISSKGKARLYGWFMVQVLFFAVRQGWFWYVQEYYRQLKRQLTLQENPHFILSNLEDVEAITTENDMTLTGSYVGDRTLIGMAGMVVGGAVGALASLMSPYSYFFLLTYNLGLLKIHPEIDSQVMEKLMHNNTTVLKQLVPSLAPCVVQAEAKEGNIIPYSPNTVQREEGSIEDALARAKNYTRKSKILPTRSNDTPLPKREQTTVVRTLSFENRKDAEQNEIINPLARRGGYFS